MVIFSNLGSYLTKTVNIMKEKANKARPCICMALNDNTHVLDELVLCRVILWSGHVAQVIRAHDCECEKRYVLTLILFVVLDFMVKSSAQNITQVL